MQRIFLKEKNLTVDETYCSDIKFEFDKGLSIYLIMTDSKTFTTLEGELVYEDKLLIHDLNSELTGVRDHINECLIKEFELYKKYQYDYKDCALKVLEIGNEMILRTPMVFGGL